MKKILFKTMAVSMAIFFLIPQAFAGTNFTVTQGDKAIVNFDENEIYSSFEEISKLENFISDNELTYDEVLATNSELLENVSSTSAIAMSQEVDSNPLIVGPFWYGCMFSALGILVVAFVTNNDPAQVKSAVTGCLITTVALPVFLILLELIGTLSLISSYY
ncbi:MAG: hypothetical protein K9H26_01715 [Prolixibacteraceae bacterium]|nr:hypothetical protein [Prolixibacteraceae bacterium]